MKGHESRHEVRQQHTNSETGREKPRRHQGHEEIPWFSGSAWEPDQPRLRLALRPPTPCRHAAADTTQSVGADRSQAEPGNELRNPRTTRIPLCPACLRGSASPACRQKIRAPNPHRVRANNFITTQEPHHALNHQPSTINHQPSDSGHSRSRLADIPDPQPLALGPQPTMTTKTELLDELRRLASEQGPNVTLYAFRAETGISRYQVYDRWGNWTTLRRAAGLPPRVASRPVYSDDELWGEFHRTARQLGHFPTRGEFSRLSERSWNTFDRRFGRRAEVLDQYRVWLDRQPADARPEFLVGIRRDGGPPANAKSEVPHRPVLSGRNDCHTASLESLPKLLRRPHEICRVLRQPDPGPAGTLRSRSRPLLVLLIAMVLTWLSSTWAIGAADLPGRDRSQSNPSVGSVGVVLPATDDAILGDAPGNSFSPFIPSQVIACPPRGSLRMSDDIRRTGRGCRTSRDSTVVQHLTREPPCCTVPTASFRPQGWIRAGDSLAPDNQSRRTLRVDLQFTFAVSLPWGRRVRCGWI